MNKKKTKIEIKTMKNGEFISLLTLNAVNVKSFMAKDFDFIFGVGCFAS